jgi:hypothetical protein
MKSCNAEASSTEELKGTERQDFMKTCLSASGFMPMKKELTPQQQKMSSCSEDAAEVRSF